MQASDQHVKDFILQSGMITPEELAIIEESRQDHVKGLGDFLVEQGKISSDDLRRVEAYLLGIPYINLAPQEIDFETLSLIPEAIARRYNMIAFSKNGDTLEVAMLDIANLRAIDFIKKKVQLKIAPRLTDSASINAALAHYRKSLKAEFDDIIEKESLQLKQLSDNENEGPSEADLQKMADDIPIVKIVDTLISHAILEGASDIHIEPAEESVVVRYRIDGILHDAMTLPKNTAPGIIARIKVLSNLKLDEKRLPQDGRFKMQTGSENVSFRVSTIPTYFGEKTVIRILKESSHGYTLEQLGLHGYSLDRIHTSMKQTTGMILVSGPTGSGKTTTLYTVLDILNTPDVNISTVEDPIEYQMPRINQSQVRADIGFTFSDGLRSLLRQDPDIIMVGEIRDRETASLAINASLTGHLVLSTIHTNSAAGSIPRMIDMGIEPFLIASTVRTIIGQRLVRRLCKKREEAPLTSLEYEQIVKLADMDKILQNLRDEGIVKKTDDWKTIVFARSIESKECPTGFSGRLGVHEVLYVSDTIKNIVLANGTADNIEKQAKSEGMLTMLEDGIFKAAQQMTSVEEVLRVISE